MLWKTMLRVTVTDHLGQPKAELSPDEVLGLVMTSEVNGEHSLEVTTTQALAKNDRLLLQDGTLNWYEYVVQGAVGKRVDGDVTEKTYWCVWSLQHDLSETYIDTNVGLVPGHASVPHPATDGLAAALGGTARWQIGTVTVSTMASGSFYRRTGWDGLATVVEKWGGEVEATIEVDSTGVTARRVNLLDRQGAAEPTRRFDWGYDLRGVKRTVSEDPWTCRIVPLGKSQETEAGGYTRRPTIASVNDGVVWLEDADAVPYTRVPDGSGGWEYPTQIVKNDTYEEPADLKAWALRSIKEYTEPRVTYECDVLQLEQAGMDARGVGLGDAVSIVDRGFEMADLPDGLRLTGRVSKVKCDLLDPTNTKVTIGTLSASLGKKLGGMSERIDAVESQIVGMSTQQATAAYVADLLGRLNAEANATGGYTYITQGEGIRTYDRAVTDPLVGAEADQVVEVKGGTIRIANQKTGDGDWIWRTVFTAGHIAADFVTAANITAGSIQSADGGTRIDLDNNEVRLGAADGMHVEINAGQLGFWQGDTCVAYIDGDQLVIPKSVVLDRMQVGMEGTACWEWVIEDSGNMSLKWVG